MRPLVFERGPVDFTRGQVDVRYDKNIRCLDNSIGR